MAVQRAVAQYLNAADRLMLVAHEGMRRMGHPGFQCQSHVWLDGRLSLPGFRRALADLQGEYPVVVSRLDRDARGIPFWAIEPNSQVEFHERELAGSDKSDVWQYAESLFDQPMDLDRQSPIAFHLLHLPDQRDVLLLRYSHVLMDGKAPEFTLSEVNRFFDSGAEKVPQTELRAVPAPATSERPGETPSRRPVLLDELADQLKKKGFRKRLTSALQVVRTQFKMPTKAALLARGDSKKWVHGPFRILVCTIDEARTKAAIERVRRLCGFANLSPAVLASTFRALRELTGNPIGRRTVIKTDVPLNLRAPGTIHPVFRNHMSFIQMSARPRELDDRDALTRSLNSYMREQIRRGVDIGTMQMMSLMAPREKLLARHLLDRMRRDPISLGFGFLGNVLPVLENFCGRRVDWFYSLNASISPPGMVMQASQFRGRMNLVFTYIGATVSDDLANQFAEFIMEDLTT